MADGDAKRSHVRIAAAILAAVVLAAVVFTYLSYTAAFTPTDKVTVLSPRAGLVMETKAKVKYRGVQIGEVESIDYAGDMAKLTLAIRSGELAEFIGPAFQFLLLELRCALVQIADQRAGAQRVEPVQKLLQLVVYNGLHLADFCFALLPVGCDDLF